MKLGVKMLKTSSGKNGLSQYKSLYTLSHYVLTNRNRFYKNTLFEKSYTSDGKYWSLFTTLSVVGPRPRCVTLYPSKLWNVWPGSDSHKIQGHSIGMAKLSIRRFFLLYCLVSMSFFQTLRKWCRSMSMFKRSFTFQCVYIFVLHKRPFYHRDGKIINSKIFWLYSLVSMSFFQTLRKWCRPMSMFKRSFSFQCVYVFVLHKRPFYHRDGKVINSKIFLL